MKPSFVKELIYNLKRGDFFGTCAKSAYYLLLAVFPFLLFLINFVRLLNLNENGVMTFLLHLFPSAIASIIEENIGFLSSPAHPGLMSIGGITGIYVASRGVFALFTGLDFSKGETRQKRFKSSLISIAMTVAFVFIIVLYFTFSVLSSRFLTIVGEKGLVSALWTVTETLLYFITLCLSIYLLYYFASGRLAKFSHIAPGSVLASVFLLITGEGFSYYATKLKDYSLVYGSLSGAAAVIAWLYLSAVVIMFGGEVAIAMFRSEKSSAAAKRAGAGETI